MLEAETGNVQECLQPPAAESTVSTSLPWLPSVQSVTLNLPRVRTQMRPLWPDDFITTA